jgi:predicted kinase
VSLDDIRGELDVDPTDNQGEVVQLARERYREFLRSKTSFAFNATNILKLTRGRWIDLQRAWLGVAQHHQTRFKICEAIAIQQRRQSGVQEQTYHDETQFR